MTEKVSKRYKNAGTAGVHKTDIKHHITAYTPHQRRSGKEVRGGEQ